MKILKSILILLLVIIVGVIGFTFTIDGAFDSSATLEMNVAPNTVQTYVSDLSTWDKWGVWVQSDPSTKLEFSDPASGEGSWYTWNGDSIGAGKLTVLELTDNSMATQLEFDGMDGGNGYWSFNESGEGTEVTWGVKGEMGMMGKLYMLFSQGSTDIDGSMDQMAGKDFVQGLDNLKVILEEAEAAKAPSYTFEEVNMEAMDIYYVHHELPMSSINSDLYGSSYGAIGAYLAEDMANMNGMPMAITHDWNEEDGSAVMDIAMPVTSDKPGNDQIIKGSSHAGLVLKGTYYGAYEDMMPIYMAADAYIKANGYSQNGPVTEIYVTDPGSEPDASKWVTDIYWAVQKN
jgi:effector-binding domain-containing protein